MTSINSLMLGTLLFVVAAAAQDGKKIVKDTNYSLQPKLCELLQIFEKRQTTVSKLILQIENDVCNLCKNEKKVMVINELLLPCNQANVSPSDMIKLRPKRLESYKKVLKLSKKHFFSGIIVGEQFKKIKTFIEFEIEQDISKIGKIIKDYNLNTRTKLLGPTSRANKCNRQFKCELRCFKNIPTLLRHRLRGIRSVYEDLIYDIRSNKVFGLTQFSCDENK